MRQKIFSIAFFLFALSFPIISANAQFFGESTNFNQPEIQRMIICIQFGDCDAFLTNRPMRECHTFTKSLRIGDSDPEIIQLKIAMQREGFLSFSDGSSVFDERLASAITGFQEEHRSEILTPCGLMHGTGFFGSLTRAKLNRLQGCVSNNLNNNFFGSMTSNNNGGFFGSSINTNMQSFNTWNSFNPGY